MMPKAPRPERFVGVVGGSKVYDPGCHCAFTDIIHWRGRVWLAFREALNHSVHPSSQIVLMASADHGRTFQVQARIAARGLDARDPHFFIIEDRLHVIIPCWRLPRERGERLTLVARSDDGRGWETFPEIPAFQDVTVWRPREGAGDGAWYAAAYDRQVDKRTGRVRLLRTEDGLDWQAVSTIHDAGYPNETELCFLPDGELLALVRREMEPRFPLLAKARPPYAEWEKTGCDCFLQGPLLERLGDGRFLVVGRSPRDLEQEENHPAVTRLFALDPETGHLEPGIALESGGDTSYASFQRLPEDAAGEANALLSYYSGHGYDNGSYRTGEQPQRCAIYVARLVVYGL